jgi:hypothetical protein
MLSTGLVNPEAKFNEMIRMADRSSSLAADEKATRISNIKGRMDVMARRVAEGYETLVSGLELN